MLMVFKFIILLIMSVAIWVYSMYLGYAVLPSMCDDESRADRHFSSLILIVTFLVFINFIIVMMTSYGIMSTLLMLMMLVSVVSYYGVIKK